MKGKHARIDDFGSRNVEVSTNEHSKYTNFNLKRTRQDRTNSYMRKATALKRTTQHPEFSPPRHQHLFNYFRKKTTLL